MRRKLLLFFALGMAVPLFADTPAGDAIVGVYMTEYNGDRGKVRVTKNADGTYNARSIWAANPYDRNGNKRKDVKNPDKALRDTPIDNVLLIENLRYLPSERSWGDAKIYDPNTGMKVTASAEFMSTDTLKVRGTFMGFGVTLYWTRLVE